MREKGGRIISPSTEGEGGVMARRIHQVEDYTLNDQDAKEIKLSSLFGKHNYLVVLHNMGKSCPNCALWGDEFDGMLKHLQRVTAFAVVGPDDPKTQKAYVKQRGWKARLYSAQGTSFIRDLGFEDKKGNVQAGISVLEKKGETLTILEQVNVMRDHRCPSVLEVLWMLPEVKTADLAWRRS